MTRTRVLEGAAAAAAIIVAAMPLRAAGAELGLVVKLDRPAPVYAIGEGLSLTIQTQREAAVQIWLLDAAGKLSRVAPETAEEPPLHARPGETLRVPARGVLRVTPPPGRYEMRIVAQAWTGESRSLGDADSRLAGRDVREQTTLTFHVEAAR